MKNKFLFLVLVICTCVLALTACQEECAPNDWSDSAISQLLPKPKFGDIDIIDDLENVFYFEASNKTENQFREYVNMCIDSGFDYEIYTDYDTGYRASNQDGYIVNLYYTTSEKTITVEISGWYVD